MKHSDWQKLVNTSADPLRAKHFLDALAVAAPKSLKKITGDSATVLVSLLAGSQALGDLLLANPDWLSVLDLERLEFPRRVQGFAREIENTFAPRLAEGDYDGALAELRRFKQREMLRIAARDLARLGDVVEITRELSDLADICLDAVLRICLRQFTEKYGQPFQQDADGDWRPAEFCVIGLGKLGGQELNYSSDVDLMFVYSDEGEVFKEPPSKSKAPRAVMSAHQYFCKLAEMFVAEVSKTTGDGFLFRVDLRLRPEGDAGPLARSLESCENYYAQWGQTWERMMLIKARRTAGDESLAAEFIETIQPFRYPRSVSENILQEIAATKNRIEKEVVGAGELERNVKLGRGGIREIEFIVQSLQALHAGRSPFLQMHQTLPCLAKLAQYNLLNPDVTAQLDAAYRFLRDVEHRLQMENNLQTHTLPVERAARLRLAKLMGFKSVEKFQSALESHQANVRREYDRLLGAAGSKAENGLPDFQSAEAEWKQLLTAHSFRDPEAAFQMFKEFAEGPGYVHVSQHTADLARQLIPKFLALCPGKSPQSAVHRPLSGAAKSGQSAIGNRQSPILSDPDRVLVRLDSFVAGYGVRAALFELWNGRPAAFELLLLLFDRSEFLAEVAIRSPDLIDDLITGERLRQRKTAAEILKELRLGLNDADQHLWLRRYHETEQMRLGLRDILGLADFEQNLAELSALADACLQYALEVVMKKNKIKSPPFAVIGFGKLGGCEIDYGSDLDIVFVAGLKTKNLPKLQKLAGEVMDLLSRRTEQGIVFQTDARLRPDGEKGLLVNTLDACENYYRKRAQLWEIQALTRTRLVAGDSRTGEHFQKLAVTLANFSKPARPLAAFTPDWKKEIHKMRLRVEKERTPPGKDGLAIKTGKGGLMDAEFIAQTLCLENGWQEPNTLRALERARDVGVQALACPKARGTLKRELQRGDLEKLIENYQKLRRVEGILRRWSYEGETVLPDEDAPYYRVSVRCGFETPEKFRIAVAKWRAAIRSCYAKVFPF